MPESKKQRQTGPAESSKQTCLNYVKKKRIVEGAEIIETNGQYRILIPENAVYLAKFSSRDRIIMAGSFDEASSQYGQNLEQVRSKPKELIRIV